MPPKLQPGSVAEIQRQIHSRLKRVDVDVYGLTRIQDKGDPRPYLGYHLLIVDSQTGMILGGDILTANPSFDEMWAKVPVRFLQTMIRYGSLPAEIGVRSERVRYFLAPMAEQLGLQIKMSRRLPALDSAQSAFDRMM